MPALPAIDRDRLIDLVRGTRWRQLELVASTGSTNADLARAGAAGLDAPRVLVAEHQSAGRGRFDRVWTAPPGANVAMSVAFAPTRPMSDWTWLPLLTGVAVVRALRAVAPALAEQFALKWPNDVLIEGTRPGKLVGILAEAHLTGSGGLAVVGVGINVGLDEAELPVDTASSLLLSGVVVDRTALIGAILGELDELIERWEQTGELRAEYRRECASLTRGLRVIVSDTQSIEGTGVDIDELGRLVVQTPTGRRAFAAGDVVHLRREPG